MEKFPRQSGFLLHTWVIFFSFGFDEPFLFLSDGFRWVEIRIRIWQLTEVTIQKPREKMGLRKVYLFVGHAGSTSLQPGADRETPGCLKASG